MMHTISGALRLLSPSSTPEVQLETQEPEEVRQSEGPQGCPLCAGDNDRVPPLRGEARRRSSGYSHELREIRETRESSPRNKAARSGHWRREMRPIVLSRKLDYPSDLWVSKMVEKLMQPGFKWFKQTEGQHFLSVAQVAQVNFRILYSCFNYCDVSFRMFKRSIRIPMLLEYQYDLNTHPCYQNTHTIRIPMLLEYQYDQNTNMIRIPI